MNQTRSAHHDELELRRELERASSGLVYSSESDRPFEFFALPLSGRDWPLGEAEFARMIGASPDSPVDERTLANFFARHTTTSDPYDTESQKIRPRYEALMVLLSTRLRDVRVFRIGKIEITCYVVGAGGSANIAGLKTIAIET
jgi:Nuclease A inhibitor-like protein.